MKQHVLVSLLNGSHPSQNMITVYALTQMDTGKMVMTPAIKTAISKSLDVVKGQEAFLDLVAKFKIKDQNQELLNIAVNNSKKEAKALAVKLLLAGNGTASVRSAISADTATAMKIITAMGNDEDAKTKDLLQSVLLDKKLDLSVREKATQMFYTGWNGQDRLMTMVMQKKLPSELDTTAERLLLKAWRQDVKQKATAFYNKGQGTQEKLAPVASLVALKGNHGQGQEVFNITCNICHQVNNKGTNFGPDLSEIGAKLSKEALYEAVINPDAGISFGYEGYLVKLKDQSTLLGYITSETKDEFSVKTMGGSVTKVKKSDIVSKKPYEHSLMPEGLVNGMKQQQVVDLIEYLAALKKKA
jgi:putative heme-binding domain-containing protein